MITRQRLAELRKLDWAGCQKEVWDTLSALLTVKEAAEAFVEVIKGEYEYMKTHDDLIRALAAVKESKTKSESGE